MTSEGSYSKICSCSFTQVDLSSFKGGWRQERCSCHSLSLRPLSSPNTATKATEGVAGPSGQAVVSPVTRQKGKVPKRRAWENSKEQLSPEESMK